MEEQDKDEPQGITRRDALRRGAIIGGTLIWAAPAVQTMARSAFASGANFTSPVGNTFSFVAVLFNCGGTYYRVKVSGQVNPGPIPSSAIECGQTWTNDGCHFAFFRGANAGPGCSPISTACPTGLTATQLSDGTITVTAPGCTVVYLDFHNGSCCVNDVPAADAQSCEGGNGTNGGGDIYCTTGFSGTGTNTAVFPGPAPNGNTLPCCS